MEPTTVMDYMAQIKKLKKMIGKMKLLYGVYY